MDEKDLTKEVLIEAAKDLSKIFEQPIETGEDAADIGLLKKDLIEAGDELQEGDSIADESKDVLITLGVKLPWKAESKTEEIEPKKTAQKAAKKAKAKKADEKRPVEKGGKKPVGEKKSKDEFGFSIKSKNSLFASAIKNKPMTMAEIKKEKWNDKNGAHYSTWKALVEMGAGQKTKEGKMSIKKNWKK